MRDTVVHGEATAECLDRGAGVSQRVPTRLTDVIRCASRRE